MTLNYTCRFCSKPGSIECDDSGMGCVTVKVWSNKIACRRCADFHTSRSKIEDQIFGMARLVQMIRDGQPDKRQALEAKASEKIERLTKKYCSLACDFFRLENFWDRDFCDMIMEHPTKAGTFMKKYLNGVSKMAREQ